MISPGFARKRVMVKNLLKIRKVIRNRDIRWRSRVKTLPDSGYISSSTFYRNWDWFY